MSPLDIAKLIGPCKTYDLDGFTVDGAPIGVEDLLDPIKGARIATELMAAIPRLKLVVDNTPADPWGGSPQDNTAQPLVEPSANANALRPDYALAARHIELLTGSADTPICFRVLTESGAASKINGTLVECWDELSKLNTSAAAWQIYFVVNEGGHSAADITRVRALFVDMDDGPIPDRWHVEPDFLTSRGPRNWHAYWLVNDMPREEFESAQLRLIQHYGSDRGIHDLPRIMRLAGSLHVKASPKGDGVVRLFTVEKMRAGKCRSSAELLTGLRQIAATPASEHVVNSDLAAADLLDLATAMQTIGNPDLEWGDWNNLGMAIWSASGGSEAGKSMWLSFCAK